MLLLWDNFSQEIVLLQQPPTEIPAAAFQALPQYSAVSNKSSSSIQMDKLEMLGFRVTGAIGVDRWSKHSSPYPGFSLRARASVLSSLFCRPSLVSRTKCCRVWQQISLLEVSLLLKSAVCAVQLILWTQQANACFSKPRIHLVATASYVCAVSPVPDDRSLKILSVMSFLSLWELGANRLFFLSKMRFTRPRLCSLSSQPDATDDRQARILSVFCLPFSVQCSV